jgi:energy-coupling factor transport system permease protein
MENLHINNPLYPILSLIASIIIFVIGILVSKDIWIIYLLISLTVIYYFYGYLKPLVKILPVFLIIGIFIGFGALLTSRDYLVGVQTAGRIILLAYSSILMISLPPINLTRNLVQINFPRSLTLGMLATIRFVPVLISESLQIKDAMKTRGVKFSWFDIRCIYRAFFVPFLMRILSMSDTLAISVQTRGFSLTEDNSTVYKEVKLTLRDVTFSFILTICLIGVIYLWTK